MTESILVGVALLIMAINQRFLDVEIKQLRTRVEELEDERDIEAAAKLTWMEEVENE